MDNRNVNAGIRGAVGSGRVVNLLLKGPPIFVPTLLVDSGLFERRSNSFELGQGCGKVLDDLPSDDIR